MQYPAQNEHLVLTWFVIGLLVVLVISLAFLFLLKMNHKKHLETQNKIENLNQQHTHKLALSSIDIQERERQRIGSDLHDSVINSLHILYLQSQLNQKEEGLIDSIQETILLTRRLSHGLNPPLLDYANLENIIRDLFQQWSAFYDLQLHITSSNSHELTAEQKKHLLRIVQELMNNIHKHAQATAIECHMRLSKHAIAFAIRDNGQGFNPAACQPGSGTQNIQLRTHILQATYKYKFPPTGTTFILLLPLTPSP